MKLRTSIVCDLFGFAEVSTYERIVYCETNSLVESMRVIATGNLVKRSVIVNMREKLVGSWERSKQNDVDMCESMIWFDELS